MGSVQILTPKLTTQCTVQTMCDWTCPTAVPIPTTEPEVALGYGQLERQDFDSGQAASVCWEGGRAEDTPRGLMQHGGAVQETVDQLPLEVSFQSEPNQILVMKRNHAGPEGFVSILSSYILRVRIAACAN